MTWFDLIWPLTLLAKLIRKKKKYVKKRVCKSLEKLKRCNRSYDLLLIKHVNVINISK